VSRASVSEWQVDKNQTSALVLLLNVLIHENENSLFFLASIIAVWLRLTLSGTFKCSNAHPIYSRSHSNLPPNFFGLFPSWKAIVLHTQKKPDDLQLIANHPVFQFEN